MYIVIELQTTNGVTGNIVTQYDNLPSADSAYHSVLSSAAISNVNTHACVMLTESGEYIKSECYTHNG